MKYFKRLKLYKANNVTFNPTTKEAFSYNWWSFVKVIEGVVVFNNYYYSPTTSKHQKKVRSLLDKLRIKVGLELPAPKGLQAYENLNELIVDSEKHLFDKFLEDVFKKKERYAMAKTINKDSE